PGLIEANGFVETEHPRGGERIPFGERERLCGVRRRRAKVGPDLLVAVGPGPDYAIEQSREHRLVIAAPVSLRDDPTQNIQLRHHADAGLECGIVHRGESRAATCRSQISRPPGVPEPWVEP